MKARRVRRGGGLVGYLRRRAAPLGYKLTIPSILGMVLLLLLGGSVGLAFMRVSAEAHNLVVENDRSAAATRLQIEMRSVMDAAQTALDTADPSALARLFQERGRLRAAAAAATRDMTSLPAADQAHLATVQEVLSPLDTLAALLERGYLDTAQGLWDRQVYDQVAGAVAAATAFQQNSAQRARAAAEADLGAIRGAALFSAVVSLLALLVFPFIGWLNHALVVAPIRQVTGAMARVAAGDLRARVDLEHKDELGQLAHSFNDMVAALAILLESARSSDLQSTGAESALLRSAQAAAGRVLRTADELEQAYRIQSALLPPRSQALPGWQIDAARIPATELGGDFYDLLNLPGGRLGLVIGDVSGHGAASALIAAWTQGMLALAAADDPDPGAVLTRVNNLLHARLPPRMFVTLAYTVLDPARGLLEYANAGQCYPLIRFRPDLPGFGALPAALPGGAQTLLGAPLDDADFGAALGDWRWLELDGLPLGMMAGEPYETVRYPLDTVQDLVLYSDGIIEARDDTGAFFGFRRLQAICATLIAPETAAPPLEPGAAADEILRQALDFAAVDRPEDDMTALIVRRDAAPVPAGVGAGPRADTRYLTSMRAGIES